MNPIICAWFIIASIAAHLPLSDEQLLDVLLEKDVDAVVTDKGVYILLPNVSFATDANDINNNQSIRLGGVCSVLTLNKVRNRYIYVEGHTDASGTDEYNLKLSQRRADTILSRLRDCGVNADKSFAIGLGEQYPISDDPAKNRRVQILLRSKQDR